MLGRLPEAGVPAHTVLARPAQHPCTSFPAGTLIPGWPPTHPPRSLTMDILRPGPALPDLQPGALPRLNAAYLTFPQLLTPLPASWGAHPGVLPALAHLSLSMRHFGGLPPQWAVGFAQLRNLILSPSDANVVHTKQVPPLPGAEAEEAALSEQWQPLRVPPEWADAGFPCLETLHLSEVRLNAGKPTTVTFYELFPQAGFPALKEL